jgi:transcriptional regulator with XRE-family HTH domain
MGNLQKAEGIQKLLAQNIKEARKKLGISQMELAKRADISAGHMNDIEACRRWVSADSLAKIARELRVKPHQLFLDGSDTASDLYDLLTGIQAELRASMNSDIDQVIAHHLPGSGTGKK